MAQPTSELAARSRNRSGGMFPQSARPPRPDIRVIAVGFGSAIINGPQTAYFPRARIWLLAGTTDSDQNGDQIDRPEDAEFALYVPTPTNDHPGRRSFGPPKTVEINGPRWQVLLADGSRASVTLAPCGCGAGLLATAGPVDGGYRIVMVRRPEWVTGH